MVCMTIFDFVIGVLFGVVLACKSFEPGLDDCGKYLSAAHRLLLRRAKFAQSQHTCGVYR